MWHTLRAAKAYGDFAASIPELMLASWRAVMLIALGAAIAATSVAISTIWRTGPADLPLLLVAFAGCTALALILLPRAPLAGHTVWLSGVAATITAVAIVIQQPAVAIAYSLLPLAAVILIGWPGALAAEAAVVFLCGWLTQTTALPPLPTSWAYGIGFVGVTASAFVWSSLRVAFQVSAWSFQSYLGARGELEAARTQRLELKQVQEDLILANQELARLSTRLKALNQVAEEARRAKEEFVANVSHELRTPLNMIIGFAEMILQSSGLYGGRLPPTLLSDIAAIERNSQHLARLVDDVLDLSQADAGRMTLSKERVALAEIVDAAVTAVRVLYESKGLYLETDLAANLPEILCDSTRVRQVLINLLSNAGRFTERGGVRVKAECQAASLVISVSDTGPGITPENLARLFEPFQQLDSSIRRRHGGSGLGLSISKRFVELTLPEVFRRAGYRTAAFGKLHFQNFKPTENDTSFESYGRWNPATPADRDNRVDPSSQPTAELDGWDGPYYGFERVALAACHGESASGHYGRWRQRTFPDLKLGPDHAQAGPVFRQFASWKSNQPLEAHHSTWVADRAIEFLEEAGEQPFFVFVSFPDPHHPFTPPAPYHSLFDGVTFPDPHAVPGENEAKPKPYRDAMTGNPFPTDGGARYHPDLAGVAYQQVVAHTHGMVSLIDHSVGRVLAKLTELGLAEGTIIAFTSDHGDFLGDHWFLNKGQLPSRSLLNIPLIISAPRGARGVVDAPCSNVDVMPALLDLCGIPVPEGVQGVILPRPGEAPRRPYAFEAGWSKASPDYHHISLYTADWHVAVFPYLRDGELYDLRTDPWEHRNLYHDPAHREIKRDLLEELLYAAGQAEPPRPPVLTDW